MAGILAWIQANAVWLLAAGWVLCEALAANPVKIEANSVFQFIYNWFKSEQPKA